MVFYYATATIEKVFVLSVCCMHVTASRGRSPRNIALLFFLCTKDVENLFAAVILCCLQTMLH